eukprot:scaffold317881_cov36-Tisochrysis_lutea.AAC.1
MLCECHLPVRGGSAKSSEPPGSVSESVIWSRRLLLDPAPVCRGMLGEDVACLALMLQSCVMYAFSRRFASCYVVICAHKGRLASGRAV